MIQCISSYFNSPYPKPISFLILFPIVPWLCLFYFYYLDLSYFFSPQPLVIFSSTTLVIPTVIPIFLSRALYIHLFIFLMFLLVLPFLVFIRNLPFFSKLSSLISLASMFTLVILIVFLPYLLIPITLLFLLLLWIASLE